MTRRHLVAVWLGFAFHVIASIREIAHPFVAGHIGWAGAMRSTIGRNYTEIGWWASRLLPYKETAPIHDPTGPIHWHHPPTINILTGLSFEVFGVSEWAAQLVTVSMAIACFWAVYELGRSISPDVGLCAAWLFVFCPVQLIYGTMLNYEVPIILCSLAAIFFFSKMSKRGDAIGVALMVLAVGFDWSGCFLAAAMGLSLLFQRRWKTLMALGVATLVEAAGLFWWLNSSANGGLIGLGQWRAEGTTERLITVISERLVDFYGWPLIVAAMIGLGWQVLCKPSESKPYRIHPVNVTFIVGPLMYFLMFKNAAIVHDFYVILMLPAFIFSASLGIVSLKRIRWISPVLKPVLMGAIVLAISAANLASMSTMELRRYGITSASKTKLKMPFDARFNEYLMSNWLREHSSVDDVIATHASIHLTPQAKFYLHRKTKHVRTLNVKNARYFVFAQRRLTSAQRIGMDKVHRTIRMLGYFIVDYEGENADDIVITYEEIPPSLAHSFFVSRHIAPYRLVQKRLAAP